MLLGMTRHIPINIHILLIGCLMLPVPIAFAATLDKTVMGIELGSRFVLPDCGAGSGTFTSRLCVNGSLTNRKPWGGDEYYVALPRSGVPPYVRGELKVIAVQGIVESVQVGTWGLQAQSGALAALTSQYGKPTRTRELKKAANSRFATRFDEWDLADFSVKLDGSTGSIDWGLIEVSTHRYQTLLKNYEKTNRPIAH
jgi:hypothetical protein